MENLGYKNENIEGKCLENMYHHLLELEKDLMELSDRELKESKQKLVRKLVS